MKDPITQYGYVKLTSELKNLTEVERPNVIKEIDIARSHGDLKENAEYHAAKEKQIFIESRINEISLALANVQIIDPASLEHKKVSFGSTVKILNLETQKVSVYTIVSSVESDPSKGLISISSPIAKSLMGKTTGEEVLIKLPAGEFDFEILEVGYRPISF